MTARRSLSPMRRLAIFEAAKGVCHLCERRIRVGEPWDVSHDRPLALGGEDGGANLKVAHRACHKAHTAAEDQPRISKAKRQAVRHAGIKKPPSFRKPAGAKFDWRLGRYVIERGAR